MAETALKKSRVVKFRSSRFRGAIKGQITSAVIKLEALFARKVEDDFDHQSIVSEVNQVEAEVSEVNQVKAKTYSSSATVTTEIKISPSNSEMEDIIKEEIPALTESSSSLNTTAPSPVEPEQENVEGATSEDVTEKVEVTELEADQPSVPDHPVSKTELKLTETEEDDVTKYL